MNQLQSVLVKPVGSFCNLQCEYCFYLEKHHLYDGSPSTHRMNDQILEKLIRDMLCNSDAPIFTWHGGEPTIMGLDFFRKVVALQKLHCRPRQDYGNALQTHGILLTPEWADFLKQENFLVGISLDGPEEIHDRYRRDRQGRGTFQRVLSNAQMLLERGVAVNILATVNDYSVNYPSLLYDFFVGQDFLFMQFMPVLERDPHNPNIAAPYSVNAQQYGQFLHELFHRWWDDIEWSRLKQKTSIRLFDTLLQIYVGMPANHCAHSPTCTSYLVVEHNGDIFSCDYLVSRETRLGNLQEMTLHQAFHSPANLDFGREKSNYNSKCRRCPWLNLCHGGCIKDRIRDPRDNYHNHFCESYQFFFQHNDAHFRKLADLYHQYYR